MSDAIQRATVIPPEWPELVAEPTFRGLRRRWLSGLDLLAPSVAAVKPAATSLIAPVVLLNYVGRGAWLSVVIAVLVALVVRAVIAEFTSRLASSGSLYTFVVRALGPGVGLTAALGLLVAYAFAGGYAVSAAGLATQALAGAQRPGAPPQAGAAVLLVLLVAVVCWLVLRRGLSTFTTLTLAGEAATIAVVAALVGVVFHRAPDAWGALSLAGADPLHVLGGATIMLAMLAGFEVSASHGPEAAKPFLTVPRAMRISLIASGVLSLATTVVLTLDPTLPVDGLVRSVRIEHLWFPGGDVASISLFRLVRIISLTAAALAFWSAVSRLIYVLACESVLPRALARISGAVPRNAILAAGPLVVVPGAAIIALGGDARAVQSNLLDGAGLLMLGVYLLVCLALPVFLAQLGEGRPSSLALAMLGAALTAAAVGTNVEWLHQRHTLALAVAAASLATVGGPLWYVVLRLRRSDVLARMGMHDQTIASDAWCRR